MATSDAYQIDVRPQLWYVLNGPTDAERWDAIRKWCNSHNFAFNRVDTFTLQFTSLRHAEKFNAVWNAPYDPNPFEIKTVRIDPALIEAENIARWRENARLAEVRGQSKVRDARAALARRGLAYENARGEIVRPKEIKDKKRIQHV